MDESFGRTLPVEVRIVDWHRDAALEPNYDEESGILELTSPISEEFAYGFQVDGTVVFDADHEKRIVNIDVLVPRKRWTVADYEHFSPSLFASLCLSERMLELQGVHRPSFAVIANRTRDWVYVSLEGCGPLWTESDTFIGLSQACSAVVSTEGTLRGVQAQLSSA